MKPETLRGLGFATSGWVTWPLVEYLIHRHIGHQFDTPLRTWHLTHHNHPNNDLIDIAPSAAIAALVATIIIPIVGIPFTVGLTAGFGNYIVIHWLCHTDERLSAKLTFLRDWHSAHHHSESRLGHYSNFGVSSAFWDRTFSTPGKPKRRIGWISRF